MKTSTLPPPLQVDGLKRNNGVDCLRGIAILLVVIHHLALRFPLTETDLSRYLPQRLLRALTWDGPKGVTLFFVISGFLITTHMVQRWENPARLDLYDFVSRRVARIMPCLIGLIVIISLLGALRVPSFVPLSAGQNLGGAAFSALFMHLNVYEARAGYLPAYWDVLWSLSVEELFYLAFPLVCLTLGRYRGGLLTCALTLALAAPWCEWVLRDSPEVWQDKAYGPGLCAIATGVVTALLFRPAVSANSQRSTAFAGWCGAAGLCAYLFWGSVVWSLFSWATPLFFNAFIALTLWAFARGWGATATRSGTGCASPLGPKKLRTLSQPHVRHHAYRRTRALGAPPPKRRMDSLPCGTRGRVRLGECPRPLYLPSLQQDASRSPERFTPQERLFVRR